MRNLKLLLFVISTLLILILVGPVAFAAEALPAETADNYMTWEFLGTMSGATAAVLLIIQFLKAPLDKLWRIPTRYVVYIISFLILISVEYVSAGVITFNRLGLILLNAIIVSIAAMGAYEATFHKLEDKYT